MLIIDADAHVMEPEDAFAERFFDPAYRDRRPRIVHLDGNLYWMVDETLFPRLKGAKNLHYMGIPPRHGDIEHHFTRQRWINHSARELTDPKDRLEVMDKAGIDIQVIHPSFFFDYPTSWGGTDPKLGSAICSAYNRWIAEKCDAADGRLSWSAQVCLDDVPGAAQEVRRAKAAGAACVYVNGTIGEKKLSSPEHYPFFEALCEEDISLSVHIGWCFPPLTRFMDTPYEARTTALIFPLLFGFSDVISADILGRFDTLHIAFLEGGCDWIPFLLDQMDNIYKVFTNRLGWKARNLPCLPQDYIRGCDRLFFNTEPDSELLPYVIGKIGNRFVVGSDMPHTETTDKRSKHRLILAREDLTAEDKQKMLLSNPKAFFRMPQWDKMAPRALEFAEKHGAS